MQTVAVIQARTGSSRLPGKVMFPLDGQPVLDHVVRRAGAATTTDSVVVATSARSQDDVVRRQAIRSGAAVYRGSESDVLGRIYEAAIEHDADIVVRIGADSPLVSPAVIDAVVTTLLESDGDYVSDAVGTRTLPIGLGAAALSRSSLDVINEKATGAHQREHVTVYYRENPSSFEIRTVRAGDIFEDQRLQQRGDVRLTLDEPADYEVLRRIYDAFPTEDIVNVQDAVAYVDREGLQEINDHVQQRGATGSGG